MVTKEKVKVSFVRIDAARISEVCNKYFMWKELNSYFKASGARGLNFPELFSEQIACYALHLVWNRGPVPGDATCPITNKKYEIKGSSNIKGDLSSFGPKTIFDGLIFVLVDTSQDLALIYQLEYSSRDLKSLKINKQETFGDQQQAGKRPRFSIMRTLIQPTNLTPTATFNLRTKELIRF